jgi:hypothetical protein
MGERLAKRMLQVLLSSAKQLRFRAKKFRDQERTGHEG